MTIDIDREAAIKWAEREYRNVDEFSRNDLEISVKAYAAGRASAPPVILAVPTGWRMRKDEDVIVVQHDKIGGYASRHNGDNIASTILYHLADDLLAAAPALQEGPEQPPEHQQEGQPAAEVQQLRAQNMLLLGLYDAVKKFIKAKGRYHTEQNYGALVGAFARVVGPESNSAAPVEQTTSTDTNNEKGQA